MIVAHMDLDAFFAAVEQLEHPEWQGQPLVVGGDPAGRGVVSTASYEARAHGIRSGMSCAEARRRCPEAIFTRPDMATYRRHSKEVWATAHAWVPRIEQVGIDEGYMDLTQAVRTVGEARELLAELAIAIRARCGLDVSFGCSTGKTVAKIASDFDKPRGLVIIGPGREGAFLAPLPVRALPGIGPVTERSLRRARIFRIADLARLDDRTARELIGHSGAVELRDRAQGIDPRPVVPEASERISIGREETFARDLSDTGVIGQQLERLLAEAIARLDGRACATVTVKVRYPDFTTLSRSCSTHYPTDDALELQRLAQLALERALRRREPPIRLLGIALSGLSSGAQLQLVR